MVRSRWWILCFSRPLAQLKIRCCCCVQVTIVLRRRYAQAGRECHRTCKSSLVCCALFPCPLHRGCLQTLAYSNRINAPPSAVATHAHQLCDVRTVDARRLGSCRTALNRGNCTSFSPCTRTRSTRTYTKSFRTTGLSDQRCQKGNFGSSVVSCRIDCRVPGLSRPSAPSSVTLQTQLLTSALARWNWQHPCSTLFSASISQLKIDFYY